MLAVGFCLGTFGTTYRALRAGAVQIDALGFDPLGVWGYYMSWNDLHPSSQAERTYETYWHRWQRRHGRLARHPLAHPTR